MSTVDLAPTSTDLLPAGASLEGSSRVAEAAVSALFPGRWSPRGLSPRPVPADVLDSLFEAARWAPSSSNDQPWRFVVATTEEELARFRPLLLDGNRIWADAAPVLAFVVADRERPRDQGANPAALFDTGAAWMALALQAHLLGLATHAMGGIHADQVHAALGLDPERYAVICAVAIGYWDPEAPLTGWRVDAERPNARRPLSEFVHHGTFRPE